MCSLQTPKAKLSIGFSDTLGRQKGTKESRLPLRHWGESKKRTGAITGDLIPPNPDLELDRRRKEMEKEK